MRKEFWDDSDLIYNMALAGLDQMIKYWNCQSESHHCWIQGYTKHGFYSLVIMLPRVFPLTTVRNIGLMRVNADQTFIQMSWGRTSYISNISIVLY